MSNLAYKVWVTAFFLGTWFCVTPGASHPHYIGPSNAYLCIIETITKTSFDGDEDTRAPDHGERDLTGFVLRAHGNGLYFSEASGFQEFDQMEFNDVTKKVIFSWSRDGFGHEQTHLPLRSSSMPFISRLKLWLSLDGDSFGQFYLITFGRTPDEGVNGFASLELTGVCSSIPDAFIAE